MQTEMHITLATHLPASVLLPELIAYMQKGDTCCPMKLPDGQAWLQSRWCLNILKSVQVRVQKQQSLPWAGMVRCHEVGPGRQATVWQPAHVQTLMVHQPQQGGTAGCGMLRLEQAYLHTRQASEQGIHAGSLMLGNLPKSFGLL